MRSLFTQKSFPKDREEETFATLRLIRSETIGPRRFFDFIKKFESALNAIKYIESQKNYPISLAPQKDIEQEFHAHKKLGATLIAWFEDDYPEHLIHIYDPPPIISVYGHISCLKKKKIAIVGARNCSYSAKKWVQKTAKELHDLGFMVASGLARGVDAAAHSSCLQYGTIAVVAGGVDYIYPLENKKLYTDILQSGAIISEHSLGTKPIAQYFPRRNRIISGISEAVIIVEAAHHSGSLHTAQFALQQNKELMVVPGSPMDPRYRGSHRLIQEGASLIQDTQDILNIIDQSYMLSDITRKEKQKNTQPFYENLETDMPKMILDNITHHKLNEQNMSVKILNFLSDKPIFIDDIVKECNKPINIIQQHLVELELEDKIIRHPGNYISRQFI